MLKSTHKPTAPGPPPPPLPAGWTAHKAPTGHTYYYNAATKESTYQRPSPALPPLAPPPVTGSSFSGPQASFPTYGTVPRLSDPATANVFLAAYDPARQQQQQQQRGGHGGGRGGRGGARGGGGRQPRDRPKSKVAIPGCAPWILVYTKYGRRFAYNPEKGTSYWRLPEKIVDAVIKLDIKGVRDKADGGEEEVGVKEEVEEEEEEEEEEEQELGSDYEEVEVTDDEDEAEAAEAAGHDGRDSKRQRTEDYTAPEEDEQEPTAPAEFTEEDMAFQLQAMQEEYGYDQNDDDYDPNNDEYDDDPQPTENPSQDPTQLFASLLTDHKISPYAPWSKLIEDDTVNHALISDPRYLALPNMKARHAAWEDWSRAQIRLVQAQRASASASQSAPKDPRIPFFELLHDKATSTKLFWPEFKRKYRKEDALRDSKLAERDREKWYREHVARLRMSEERRKKDLVELLRSVRREEWGKVDGLPEKVRADLRFVSLDGGVRDQLVEGFVDGLGGPS